MNNQTLSELSTGGPDWLLYAVAVLLAVLSVLLLAGKGAWLIAGYNTASKEEKKAYDEKKLCRTVGGGLAVLTVFLFVMKVFEDVLPANVIFLILAITFIDSAAMIILCNTVCKRKK